ncbi:hypothetical protein Tco_0519718 [Tanacetum coccineum]
MVDSQGLIPMMPPAQDLKSIQDMADHSQNWYDGATTWQWSGHNSDDIAVITNRLDSLGCDMQKLKESIHAVQEELNKKQAADDEWIRRFRENTDLNLMMLDAAIRNLGVKVEKLTLAILTNEDDTVNKGKAKIEKVEGVKKESVPCDLPIVNPYVEPIVPPIPFLGHLKEQEDEAQAFRTLEGLKKQEPINEEDAVKLNDRCSAILQNLLPPKENDLGSFTLPCLIGSLNIRNALANLGASINVMPFFMFKRLNICNLQPTNMIVEMVDMTKKAPKGIIENVLASCDPCAEKCDNKNKIEDIRNLWAYSYDDERIKIPWKDMPFEDWNKFLLGVKPNNIKEVVVDCTRIMAEIDTDRRAQGAT